MKKKKNENKILSIVKVDAKGQFSISQEIRAILGLEPKDKVAIYAKPATENTPAYATIVNVDDILDQEKLKNL